MSPTLSDTVILLPPAPDVSIQSCLASIAIGSNRSPVDSA